MFASVILLYFNPVKKYFVIIFIIFHGISHAQQEPAVNSDRLNFEAFYTDMNSTHGTRFRGVGVEVNKPVSSIFSLGIGFEYSGSSYHPDNGYDLFNLNFLPVYINQKLKLSGKHKLTPVLDFSEGLSVNTYRQELPNDPASAQDIHEMGLYLYGGAGLLWKFSKISSLIVDVGVKSYNVTFNNLDVNPRGLSGKIGLIF